MMKSKEAELLTRKKSERGDLRMVQTTIATLKKWLKQA